MKITVQMIKLTSGETVVADVVEEKPNSLIVTNPLEIKTEHSGRSRGTLIAMQWLPLFEDENYMTIQKMHIIGMATASDEMIEYYVNAIDNILNPDKLYERAKDDEELLDKLTDPANYANTNSDMIH